jgi:hypothetical protein
MQLGIAGFRASGKTTVFNCLTGADASTGYGGAREANRGVIKVPDDRVDKLSAIYSPKKTTYADITFVDLPGAEEKALDSQTAAELRGAWTRWFTWCAVSRRRASAWMPSATSSTSTASWCSST